MGTDIKDLIETQAPKGQSLLRMGDRDHVPDLRKYTMADLRDFIRASQATQDFITKDQIRPGSYPDNSIQTSKLRDGAITTGKLAAGSVTTTELADASVTFAKMQTAKGFYATSVAGQSIPHTGLHTVVFANAEIDACDYDTVTGISTTNAAGRWAISASLAYLASATGGGNRGVVIRVAGGNEAVANIPVAVNEIARVSVSIAGMRIASGVQVLIAANQTSGAALALDTANKSHFSMTYLGR